MKKSPREMAGVIWKSGTEVRVRDAAISQGADRNAAWMEIVRRHGPALTRAIEGILLRSGRKLDHAAVDDLVETTWLRVTKGGGKKLREWDPRGRASLGTHIVRIGMGVTLTWCRFRATRREVMMDTQALYRLADQPDGRLSPEQIAWLNEAEQAVKKWEFRLEGFEREVLRLWREGRDQAAIAQALGRSQQFVSKTLTGLMAMARRLIEDPIS